MADESSVMESKSWSSSNNRSTGHSADQQSAPSDSVEPLGRRRNASNGFGLWVVSAMHDMLRYRGETSQSNDRENDFNRSFEHKCK